MNWNIYPLLKYEMLGVFVNTLTADDKYPVLDCNLNIFKKKKIVLANVFRKLQTVKDLVRALSKKHSFRTFSRVNMLKRSQTLVKLAWEHFCHISSFLWEEMICKISPLVKFDILGVFADTLTADDKYHVRDCENLLFPIQRQLS